jgi:hypothetical protein
MKAPKIRGCCGTVAQPATPHKPPCPHEATRLAVQRSKQKARRRLHTEENDRQFEPDYESQCEGCGSSPVMPLTGMCGSCTFGEADTIGGNW